MTIVTLQLLHYCGERKIEIFQNIEIYSSPWKHKKCGRLIINEKNLHHSSKFYGKFRDIYNHYGTDKCILVMRMR